MSERVNDGVSNQSIVMTDRNAAAGNTRKWASMGMPCRACIYRYESMNLHKCVCRGTQDHVISGTAAVTLQSDLLYHTFTTWILKS